MLKKFSNHLKDVKFPSATDHLIYWFIICAGVIADLWSKTAVFNWLDYENTPNRIHHVIEGLFTIVMRVNQGAAWSIASGQRVLLVSVSILALFVVVGIFIFGNLRHKLMQIALAMFTAGIIGNLYDRVFNDGGVRDFLDFYVGDHHWPAFNIADSMLCVAVGLLIIFNIAHSTQEQTSNSGDTTEENK